MKAPLPPTFGKPVAILGLGRSGKAAARLLLAKGVTPIVLDTGDSASLQGTKEELAREGIDCFLGAEALGQVKNFAWGILSPGIDPTTPLVREFTDAHCALLAEIEVAWRCCDQTVVAITGTNGKTTTTGLITHLLNESGISAVACGNIGEPFSAALLDHPETKIFVLEVSSFQLEACDTFQPPVAVWMNFSANHLDRYADVEEYYTAKARIFANQSSEDVAIVQFDSRLPELSAKTITFSATNPSADFSRDGGLIKFHGQVILDQEATKMPGAHNAENLMAALGVIQALGFPWNANAATSYQPPEHRCEFVRELDDVLFLNDSKSTNLDALEKAIRAQTRPIILIAGGKDKGFGFSPLAPLVQEKVIHAILIGQLKERIAQEWKETPHSLVADLPSAVSLAKSLASPGTVVLFSPGTSSYDMFRDYEERGQVFKAAVHSLSIANQ